MACSLGRMPTTLVRRLTSAFKRSRGLVVLDTGRARKRELPPRAHCFGERLRWRRDEVECWMQEVSLPIPDFAGGRSQEASNRTFLWGGDNR